MPLPPLADENFDPMVPDRTLAVIERGIARYGDLFRLQVTGLSQPAWVATHPDHAKQVLVSNSANYTKGMGLERVRILLGNGIMVSEGDFWRRQRRMIQPSFAPRLVARFRCCTEEVVEAVAERWKGKAATGEPVSVTEEMSLSTLDIVLKAIFGADLAALCARTGVSPFALIAEHGERDLKFAVKFRALGALIVELVREKRKRRDAPADTLLSDLMLARDPETGAGMDERALIDEVMTLIVAGHETTASSLAFAWHLLAGHPQIQEKLSSAVIPAKAGIQNPDSTERLGARLREHDEKTDAGSYVDQVIQETLRLYPPGWLLTRRAITEDGLGGFRLPVGADVFICVYSLHRHPQFWDEPEAFRPERFASDAAAGRHRYAYLPFAMGPRRCVGESLAMLEMRLHLATLARRFRLTPVSDEPMELEPQVNLRTRKPLLMRIEAT